jgi:hypothetical protein
VCVCMYVCMYVCMRVCIVCVYAQAQDDKVEQLEEKLREKRAAAEVRWRDCKSNRFHAYSVRSVSFFVLCLWFWGAASDRPI